MVPGALNSNFHSPLGEAVCRPPIGCPSSNPVISQAVALLICMASVWGRISELTVSEGVCEARSALGGKFLGWVVQRLTAEQEVAVGDLDGEFDAEIDERFEAFEVGDHLGQLGGFIRTDITAIAALTEGIAQLPIRAIFLAWALELLAEGTGPHGAELVDGGLGLIELFLPGGDFFVLHTDLHGGPLWRNVKLFPMKCGFFWWRRHRPRGR